MTHAEMILGELDRRLGNSVDLTLYGRAALQLGFENPRDEFAKSLDVDVILWLGQAEELEANTNFWQAVDQVNQRFADQNLYISHFFEENQVILLPTWKTNRIKIDGPWKNLQISRLGNTDLLLTKLMRDDPIDQADAFFIVRRSGLTLDQIKKAMSEARIVPVPEIQEQFEICSQRLLKTLANK